MTAWIDASELANASTALEGVWIKRRRQIGRQDELRPARPQTSAGTAINPTTAAQPPQDQQQYLAEQQWRPRASAASFFA